MGPIVDLRARAGLDAASFRPEPAVDAAVLRVRRRTPPLLPEHMAAGYAAFVRGQWK